MSAASKGWRHGLIGLAMLALGAGGAGCEGETTDKEPAPRQEEESFGVIARPQGFPQPALPERGWPSQARFELGRALFYERALSGNGTQSCAGCHEQAHAFAEPRAQSQGSTGQVHRRNASSLVNVAFNASLTWANPELVRLEEQIRIPLFGDRPVEMGAKGKEEEIMQRLRDDPRYVAWFRAAYPGDRQPINWERSIEAIADFVRSLISGSSSFDRFVYGGDRSAMSDSQQRGMTLFFSERLECHHCHGGFNFTESTSHAKSEQPSLRFHNTGLYNLDGAGAYPATDRGVMDVSGLAKDMGRFRAPTLRNVALSAPYMHDGSMASLEEVVAFYEAGGRVVESGPAAGDGRVSPLKSGFVPGFALSDQERSDLINFLHSLSDESFVTDPRFANPHQDGPS